MSEKDPGRAEYETWRAAVPDYVCNVPAGPWEGLPATIRAGFAAIAGREPQPAPGVGAPGLEALASRWEAEAEAARALPGGEFTRDRRVQAYAFDDCARSLRRLTARCRAALGSPEDGDYDDCEPTP